MKNQLIILTFFLTLLSFKAYSEIPAILSISPSTGTVGSSITISGANFYGVTGVSFNGVAATSFNVVSETSVTAVAPVSTSGNVTVTTTAGTSNGAFFSYSAPVIASISPSIGSVGSSITISGANFYGVTGVSFNGVAATSFNVVSETSITAVVPVSTSGNVTVTTTAGTFNGAFFSYSAPVIAFISPSTGPVGTSITISGANFYGVTGVSFNGVAATSFNVVSETSVTAVAPVSTSGNVTVTTTAGTSNGVFFDYSTTITGIQTTGLNDDITVLIYRNATNQITIQLQNAVSANASATIFNTLGQRLETSTLKNETTTVGTSLTSGVYIVRVTNGGKTGTNKITIK